MSDKNLPLKNLIEVRNLKIVPRANPRYAILKGISFEVKAGESLALLGESGAGKSLALQAVCGLLSVPLKYMALKSCLWVTVAAIAAKVFFI